MSPNMSPSQPVGAAPYKELSPLEKLPQLVIESICEYLVQPDSLKHDLASFSLASTQCAVGASRFRLRRLQLHISGPKKLIADLHQVSNEQLRHLRQIRLTGSMLDGGKHLRSSTRYMHPSDVDANFLDLYGDFCELPTAPRKAAVFDPFGLPLDEQAKEQLDDAWRPFSDFILKLSSLTDLVYCVTEQFPRCLLEFLHQHSPKTRLHNFSFSFRSLYGADHVRNLDPDEYKLASSPSLSSVAAVYYPRDGQGDARYNKEGLLDMVSGLAPNLKSLAVWSCPPRRVYHDSFPRPQWRGFFGAETDASSKGHLENIVCYPHDIESLLAVTHTETLQTMNLVDEASNDQVQRLGEIVKTENFDSLRSLTLGLKTIQTSVAEYKSTNSNVCSLFQHLPPLQSLHLSGAIDGDTFHSVLDYHGESLEYLKLVPEFAYCEDDAIERLESRRCKIEKLSERCRKLTQLDLMLNRSEGDEDEVAMYRALGRISSLRILDLKLDWSNSYNFESPWGTEGNFASHHKLKIPRLILRQALANSAIDSTLARSVWGLLRSEGSRVQHLRVQPYSMGREWSAMSDCYLKDIVTWIGQAWVCTQMQNDEQVSVQNINGHARGNGEVLSEDFGQFHELRDVWTDIWPGPTGDRREAWSSLPLKITY